jgi:hypothetical protein
MFDSCPGFIDTALGLVKDFCAAKDQHSPTIADQIALTFAILGKPCMATVMGVSIEFNGDPGRQIGKIKTISATTNRILENQRKMGNTLLPGVPELDFNGGLGLNRTMLLHRVLC